MNHLSTIASPVAATFDFVQLDRTFHELSKYASEADNIDIGQAFHVGDRLTWANLVDERRLIILAEAGSGKTAEIRSIAHALRRDGRQAFFLRLEHIPHDLEIAFEVGTYAEFRAWLATDDEGWLLLDSVDEARLRNPRDFELAITKLASAISGAMDRTHIAITGRTTAWRPKTDLAHCRSHLPYAAPAVVPATKSNADTGDDDDLDETIRTERQSEPADVTGFRIVTLDDLRSEQVALFIRARGVGDTQAFLDAVERADAWSFTARPQDLEDLVSFWLANGRIGSRLEIMRNSIDRRLSERDQGRAEMRPLAMERARNGAMLLAAATTLSKNPTIRVPDGADNTNGISVQAVLPDWDEAQQSALLSRPIFDEAIYGAVRFHHRSVREYLTAEWFAKLLARQTSRRTIEDLFFREQYGTLIVTPTLRPILPWLALLDDKIRERIKRVAPEVALEGGDPSQLPFEDRRQILRDVCALIAAEKSNRSIHGYSAVQRFASPDLTKDIRVLLRDHADNDELSSFLLRMVWLGELNEALPEVLDIALDEGAEQYKRQNAFRALKVIGSEADRQRVRDAFVGANANLDRELLAELMEGLSPTAEHAAWLVGAIGKAKVKIRYSVDALGEQITEFARRAPLDVALQLAAGILPLLSQPPVIERRYNDVSQKFEWLLAAAAVATERLLSARYQEALGPTCFTILRMVSGARGYQSEELSNVKTEFAALVTAWPEFNRAFFWFEVERTRENPVRKGERLVDYWHASIFGTFWSFSDADFDYVSQEIANQDKQDNKLVALSLAFHIYREAKRPRKWRERLKALADGNSELAARLSFFLHPPAQPEPRRWKAQERRWKKRHEAFKAKEAKDLADSKAYLLANVGALRATQEAKPGQFLQAHHYLFNRSRGEGFGAGRWTRYNWRKLALDFGEQVASFYRDSAVAFWRHHSPKLRSQGAPHNETPFGAILGLVGLEIESHETPDWPSGLSAAEAELASRYASFELNGFPTWFQALFESHPDAVSRFLLSEIRYELAAEKPDADIHYILSDISWSGQWCWNHLGPMILHLLRGTEPTKLDNLGKLLKIAQGSSVSNDELAILAAAKCAALGDSPNAALWFAVWTGAAPDDAIPALSARLDSIAEVEERISFAMTYVTHLVHTRRRDEHGAARDLFHTPTHLKTLYLLISNHVRREDDIERAGTGVYSPGLRDNAQDARNALMEILLKMPGKEAYLAILEVAEAFPERPWLARLAKEQAERDGDLEPISPAATREIHDRLERTPTNHRELADLAFSRLIDLKDELENGDSSIAGILRGVALETDMRKYIGKELRDKAQGRYVIPQEEELADAKKPDLRFHGVGFDAPVPTELKLADKWTGPELFERLENQLCGDYLRDNRSTRGIFALVHGGSKTGWDIPGTGQRVDFDGLLGALQNKWSELSSALPKVDDVRIVGIDLTKRG